jgi:hypothetical protein
MDGWVVSGGWREKVRGVYRFSSLVKQNRKAKICFVIHIAGERKLLFYIYAVIVKQNFYKQPANLLRYVAHAAALRTSDLDTGFFHTDMKVLAGHFHNQPTVLYCVPTNPDPRSFCARPVR